MRHLLLTALVLACSSRAHAQQLILDSDPEINAVMIHWMMTEPVTDPKKREELRKLYPLVPKQQATPLMGMGVGRNLNPPKKPLPPEGSLGTRIRLFKPEDVEQQKAAVILLEQPEPTERLAHYATILANNYFLGWTLDIREVNTEKGVSTVKAVWHPRVISYEGRFSVCNTLNEVWEINGESVKLVKAAAYGPAILGPGVGVGGYGEYLLTPDSKPAEKSESKDTP